MTEAVQRDLTILELIKAKAQDLREAQAHVARLKAEIASIRKGIGAALNPKRTPRQRSAAKAATSTTPKSRRRGMPAKDKTPVVEG